MMQFSPELTCTFVTIHALATRKCQALLSVARILEVIELHGRRDASVCTGHEPRLVVCGLNPHAGEHGLFGEREEERIIIPAIEAARAQGLTIEGPLPPDTAFLPWKRKSRPTPSSPCMYHDQGRIPVKAAGVRFGSKKKKPGMLRSVTYCSTGRCAIHCRYCFRRHYPYSEGPRAVDDWGPALDRIAADDSIDEVLLSGGDPLTIVDHQLNGTGRVGSPRFPHVRRLRVHTRLP